MDRGSLELQVRCFVHFAKNTLGANSPITDQRFRAINESISRFLNIGAESVGMRRAPEVIFEMTSVIYVEMADTIGQHRYSPVRLTQFGGEVVHLKPC